MTTAALSPGRATGPGRGALTLIASALLIGVIFIGVAALPYYSPSGESLARYEPIGWVLLVHITTGMAALLVGPYQLWIGLARKSLPRHRLFGKIYMGAVVVSSVAAYTLALNTKGGWVFGSGLAGLATAWLITTGMAYAAIRRRLIEQHQEWMIRSYVVTFAFVFFRMMFTALQAAGAGTLNEQLGAAAWFCWSLPLVVTEAFLQGRKVFAARPRAS
jgi:uncharacterized membrane protein YozB (DUF420 family)